MSKFKTDKEMQLIQSKYQEFKQSGVPGEMASRWAEEFEQFNRDEAQAKTWHASRICALATRLAEYETVTLSHLMQALAEYEQSVRARIEKLEADAGADVKAAE